MDLYIGTSGFSYQHWRGVFYPEGLPQGRWLEYYSERFGTVELNITFYRLPTEKAVQKWGLTAPEGFIFAVKLSRYITHLKKLHGVGEALDLFLSRARLLGSHLGPILIQLPPNLSRDVELLDNFLSQCDPALRWAVEFRNPSWLHEETFRALSRHNVALCIHDLIENHPLEVTAPFVYLRFHGASGRYEGKYADDQIGEWAERVQQWRRQRLTVYAYFNNDSHGYAVQNARTLRTLCEK